MRKIKTVDVFEALRLVQKSGLKEELVPVIEKLANETVEHAGIMGFLTLVEVFADAKSEKLIYEWLAKICECSPKEIAEWDLDTLATNMNTLAEENDLRNFFTSLSGLISKKR